MASLALTLHATITAHPRHGSCQALITLTRRHLSVSRALHVLSSCVLCLAPPAVDLLKALALGWLVCTRWACCFCLRMSATFVASVELLPRGWRAITFPRWLHVLKCSTWGSFLLFIVASAASVYETRDGLASSVCTCRTFAASVELLPRGWRAVAFPRWLHVLSCSTWLIVHCCIGGLCFGFIGANTWY